jgi:Flp pilus assembly protein TadG
MPSRLIPRRLQLRRGTVAPLTILCLGLLVGVTALVIDGGTLMEARRHVQAAADAAALAGAEDLYANYLSNQGYDYSGTAQNSALTTASANGFTSGDQSIVTATVRTSPTSSQTYQGGPNAGQTIPPGYIEVTIQYNAFHLFSGVFGCGSSPIRARAVARGQCSPLNSPGVMALNLGASGALNVAGAGGLTVSGGIQVNSNSKSGLQAASNVTATQFILNPAMAGSGGGGGGLLGAVLSLLGSILSLLFGPGGTAANVVTSPPAPDPLRFLPPPDPATLKTQPYTNLNITGGNWELHPGVYNGGIRISGFGTQVTLHTNSGDTPGIYYLNGQNGFQVTEWATVKTASGETAGILIYNNWNNSSDTIYVNTFGSLSLFPAATGLYRGLSIFQKRGTPSDVVPPVTLSTLSGCNWTGTIYAARASVSLSAYLGTNVMGGQVIADTVSTGGLATVNINPGAYPAANQRQLGLVE